MVEGSPSEWLYDYTLQFLASPGWKIPILSFIDEKCYAFNNEDENRFEHTTIHNEFQEMIDTLLENICIEIGATHEMFFQVVKAGMKNPSHKKYFEQILATLNFLAFKKLMIKRNTELELEALNMMQTEGFANTEDVKVASLNKDQADLEHAIAMSLAADEERMRLEMEEEELMRKVMESSEMEYKAMLEAENTQKAGIMKENQRKEAEKIAKMEEKQRKKYEENKKVEEEKKRKEEEEYKKQEEIRSRNSALEEETRRKLEEERKRSEIRRQEEQQSENLRKEAKRIEEEAKRRETEKQLPPVTLKKTGNVDISEFKRLDITSELKESEELDALNKKIAEKYQQKPEEEKKAGGESLEDRTARLKRQREILLKKKQQERANEMEKYISDGGTDLTVKKTDLANLPPVISQDVLEKRREIINRIKQLEN